MCNEPGNDVLLVKYLNQPRANAANATSLSDSRITKDLRQNPCFRLKMLTALGVASAWQSAVAFERKMRPIQAVVCFLAV